MLLTRPKVSVFLLTLYSCENISHNSCGWSRSSSIILLGLLFNLIPTHGYLHLFLLIAAQHQKDLTSSFSAQRETLHLCHSFYVNQDLFLATVCSFSFFINYILSLHWLLPLYYLLYLGQKSEKLSISFLSWTDFWEKQSNALPLFVHYQPSQ